MALAMATLVVAPANGLGQLLYFCSMTGAVGPQCCCEHEAEALLPDGLSISAAPCCDIVNQETRVPPARLEAISPDFDGPDHIAAHPSPIAERQVAVPSPRLLPRTTRGPPFATGPPLYVENCTYLI